MAKRFISIWFRRLATDWVSISQPHLRNVPFVLRLSSKGRMIVAAVNSVAERNGINVDMPLADARAIIPNLEVRDNKPELMERVLKRLAEWCIRFTPVVAVDPPSGLLLDVSGCSHLWGGDELYVAEITKRLCMRGYDVSIAMADTIGTAWGVARYGKESFVIPVGHHLEAILSLPPEALRIENESVERLCKLGLNQIKLFSKLNRSSLRKRFGEQLLFKLDMATGKVMETINPVVPIEPYHERLPCMEPIVTAAGIEIALRELLSMLCNRLQQEQKGLRNAVFKCYRVDAKIERVDIGTDRPSHDVQHLFKLFEIKLTTIEPDLGIELFILEASKVEDHHPKQEMLWSVGGGLEDHRLSELIDRLVSKFGPTIVNRYLPDEHYWPERSIKRASSLSENSTIPWPCKQRPLQLLHVPERIEVTAPIPDYPPMLFRYNGKIHKIVNADGPERIEQEWWLQQGQHRDYYYVEDEECYRYWIFRLGHYDDKDFQWFIHGFFQ